MRELRTEKVAMSTVLICSVDPADRAIAKSSFGDHGWYVIESIPEDVRQVVRSIKLDAVIVIGSPATHAMAVGLATADARISVQQIARVRFAGDAFEAATQVTSQVSGIARKR